MTRGALTHRAAIERNTAVGSDAWNRPAAPTFTALATLSCRAWSRDREETRDDGKTVVIEEVHAVFPPGSDVQTDDRVANITDRRGRVVFAGPLAVRRARPQGYNARHLEVILTRHK